MADPRFFRRHGPHVLGALAQRAAATLEGGDPELAIADVAPLDRAGAGELTFYDNAKYPPPYHP